jgi:hypothetical protein
MVHTGARIMVTPVLLAYSWFHLQNADQNAPSPFFIKRVICRMYRNCPAKDYSDNVAKVFRIY